MARKIPETVYLVTGNNHNGERIPYAVCAQECHADFKVRWSLSMNPNTEAEYHPIKKEDIPRGWKTKVVFK